MSYDDEYQQSVTLDDLLEDGRFAEAEEVLGAIAAQHPAETWVHSIRALCLAELGRDGEAIASSAKAVRLEPDDAYARWVMGALLCDRNRLDDAMEQAREAVRLDPGNPRVHALHAQIHRDGSCG